MPFSLSHPVSLNTLRSASEDPVIASLKAECILLFFIYNIQSILIETDTYLFPYMLHPSLLPPPPPPTRIIMLFLLSSSFSILPLHLSSFILLHPSCSFSVLQSFLHFPFLSYYLLHSLLFHNSLQDPPFC